MLTQEYVRARLSYDPETGIFTWKDLPDKARSVKVGDLAGYLDKSSGYIRIKLNGRMYFAHRLAYLYMEGYFPEHEVDHINGRRSDNRWENLRHVSAVCNMQNMKVSARNSSGVTGVSWHKQAQKWYAYAALHGKLIFLGLYPSRLEAALARLTFEIDCPQWHCDSDSSALRFCREHMSHHDFSAIEENLYNHE